jgi:ubiquinone biosynthesis protein UbiJ
VEEKTAEPVGEQTELVEEKIGQGVEKTEQLEEQTERLEGKLGELLEEY